MRTRSRVAATLALAGAALLAYGTLVEPAQLVVVEGDLPVRDARLDGLRIALLSDLHVGAPHVSAARLPEIVRRVEEAHPDVVLIAGDFVITGVFFGEHVTADVIGAGLAGLTAPDGAYAVLGNHDHWEDARSVEAGLSRHGLPVLSDHAHRIEGGAHGAYWIVGVDDLTTSGGHLERGLAEVTDDAPVLLLTHNPDLFPEVPGRVAATFAGHTHGGQVRLPWIGAPWAPIDAGYLAGPYVVGRRSLFVTTGIGTSVLPLRIGVVPRIDVVTLRAADG